MFSLHRAFWISLAALIALGAIVLISSVAAVAAPRPSDQPAASGSYSLLTWNDLGMHCYNRSFDDLAVLPPANTLWAQVVKVGNPPQVITTGLTVEYFFADNTNSTSKSNFWSINPYNGKQNAQSLFGLSSPLADNMGLAGKGISGMMDAAGDHFEAKWIPLTEYSDSNPNVRDPYQLATVVVRDANTHVELTRSQVVAPVSTEMHCDNCHYNNGPGNEGISSPTVEQNILKKHDEENMDDYPAGHRGALMTRRPVLCGACRRRCTKSTAEKCLTRSTAATTAIPARRPNACAMSCRSCPRPIRRPASPVTAPCPKSRRIRNRGSTSRSASTATRPANTIKINRCIGCPKITAVSTAKPATTARMRSRRARSRKTL